MVPGPPTGIQLPGPGGIGPGRGSGVSQTSRVRALVAEHVPDDLVVLVTELACSEPGCPPVETVIALMYPGNPHQFKLPKAVREVTADDVRQVLTTQEGHEH
ncbi:hypothetical protein [Granulicoccus phenolivorans]|uniref:hypothetical protein n=1 Tax=Granulicoccus phenolivorans TaxID=266854 RepID=UPI00040BE040|nr:hypothetical protein [Granulicoccus phenolivorans]